ncbi:MAG TPA: hypothetical protein VHG52_05275 [Thermomicrobiales bacterium]|nr:hypothetical protein [Thermomicrobiales bacterium]
MGTILVLADRQDLLAAQVVIALRNARQSVCVLTPFELSLGSAWTHTVNGRNVELDLRPNGASLGRPRAVLNRLHAARFFPENVWGTASEAVYAEAQFSAVIASWLAGLRCLVLGPTSGGFLYRRVGVMEWHAAAREAWLPIRAVTLATGTCATADRGSPALNAATALKERVVDAHLASPLVLAEAVTTMRAVYVIAGQVVGAPDESLVPGVQRLAEQSGCNLLECHFGWTAATPGRWVFCDATAVPLDAPPAVLDAIVASLAGTQRLQNSRTRP